jgi:hypothetical protein
MCGAYRVSFLGESVDENLEQFASVVDRTCIFSNYPDQRRLGLWFIQLVQIGAQNGDDAFVGFGIFAEDILGATVRHLSVLTSKYRYLHHDHSFLNNVADPRPNQLQQHVHTSFCGRVDLDRCLTNSLDALSNKVYIDF